MFRAVAGPRGCPGRGWWGRGLHGEGVTPSRNVLSRCPSCLDDLGSAVPEDPSIPTPTAVFWPLGAPSPEILHSQSRSREAPSPESGWSRRCPSLSPPLCLPSRFCPAARKGGICLLQMGRPKEGCVSCGEGCPARSAPSLGWAGPGRKGRAGRQGWASLRCCHPAA